MEVGGLWRDCGVGVEVWSGWSVEGKGCGWSEWRWRGGVGGEGIGGGVEVEGGWSVDCGGRDCGGVEVVGGGVGRLREGLWRSGGGGVEWEGKGLGSGCGGGGGGGVGRWKWLGWSGGGESWEWEGLGMGVGVVVAGGGWGGWRRFSSQIQSSMIHPVSIFIASRKGNNSLT